MSKDNMLLDGNGTPICKACKKPAEAGERICRPCGKCINCRKHYKCATSHKRFTRHCPDFKPQCAACRSCKKSCKCWECSSCKRPQNGNQVVSGNRKNKPCDDCTKCATCCKCLICVVCVKNFNSKPEEYCESCRMCEGDCRCPGVSFTRENRITFHDSKDKFEKNPSKRFIAAELEVAGVKRKKGKKPVNAIINKYSAVVKRDGSLPEGGFEINMSPSNGDMWLAQSTDICNALAEQDAFVTKECGMHVHIDARDYNYADLRRLALFYSRFEGFLYDIVAANRRTNTYCRPCGNYYRKVLTNMEKDGNFDRKMKGIIYGELDYDRAQRDRDGYDGSRYHALNLHAWFAHQTVECRLHEGSIDAKTVSNWGMMWANILDYVKGHSDREIEALNGEGYTLLEQIITVPEVKDWLKSKSNPSKVAQAAS